MSDTTTLLSSVLSGAGTGLLGYFGRGWRDDKRKQRKDAGDLANDILEQTLARIAKLESENADCAKRLPVLERQVERTVIVVNLVTADLHERAPSSPALKQARAILGDAFPIDLSTPPDMLSQLDKLK